ncbi:CoA-transferase family III domain-containing protein, partial [Blyttiomyces helicus]
LTTLTTIFKSQPTSHWLQALKPLGIPFAPVNNIRQTFDLPQVKHRNMIAEVDHPKSGKIRLTGIPVKFSGTPSSIRRPPPMLGEHTADVLRESGYSEVEIEGFVRDGVV